MSRIFAQHCLHALTIVVVLILPGRVFAMLHPQQGRFMQRDQSGYVDGMGLYEYVRSDPVVRQTAVMASVLAWFLTPDEPQESLPAFRMLVAIAGCAFALFCCLLIWLFRRKRRRPSHCLCGYDLRASDARCPECGTAIDPRR